MTNKDLAQKIIDLAGGNDNIDSATHCMTRLRMKIKDEEKVDIEALKKVDGVLGVVQSDTLQVVIGPGKVNKIYDIATTDLGVRSESEDGWEEVKKSVKSGQKETKLTQTLKLISNIFIPMIPAIIAAGLFFGFYQLIFQFWAPKSGLLFLVGKLFQLIGNAFLGYFAIFTGVNAAREFKTNQTMGGMIGVISISPVLIEISTALGLYNTESPLNSILTTGKGGILGVIVGVWILSIIERNVRKFIPDVLDLILTPFISLFVTALIFVFIVMPATGVASDVLVSALNVIIASSNPVVRVISGFVLAAVFLPMVLVGLHHGLIAIYAIQLEALGGVTLFPVLAMAGAGQVGASIALYFKAKKRGNVKLKNTIIAGLPAGFLGVGEPLIYGVTLPLGKPFITAGLGAGFGGAYVMLMGVMALAWGPSGLVAIPLMKTPILMLHFFIGLVISYVMGFIFTSVFIKTDSIPEEL